MYQALYRKWRPRTFDEVTGQEHITETLKTQVKTGRLSHAYLFTGTRGTGKTTCAKLLARAVNCERPAEGNPCNTCATCKGIENGSILDVLELDAASNNGVDHVRALRDEAIYAPAYGKKRVYIVDEVHMLSGAAFNALLKILEEPPAHLMFILATTELYKVPATILSRCQRFAFRRLLPDEIAKRLLFVSQKEQIPLTQDGAVLLARLADGSMRDALSLLDQCSAAAGGALDGQQVLSIMGLAGNLEITGLMEAIGHRDTAKALSHFAALYEGGKELGSLLGELSLLARDMLIMQTVPATGETLLTGGYEANALHMLAALFSQQRLMDCIASLSNTQSGFARSTNRRTDAELCIIRLCEDVPADDYKALSARVAKLEQALADGAASFRKTCPESGGAASTSLAGQRERIPSPSQGQSPKEPLKKSGCALEQEQTIASAKCPKHQSIRQTQPDPSEADKNACRNTVSQKGAGEFWPQLVSALKGKIGMPEYSIMNNSTMVSGEYAEGILTITVDSEFTHTLVNQPAVLQALSSEAESLFGRPLRVIFARSPHQKRDKMDDLLALSRKFDNISIE